MTTHSLPKVCKDIKESLKSVRTLNVVHHWDSDGVASAALISRVLNSGTQVKYCVPQIGRYSAEAVNTEELIRSAPVLVLDYGLGTEDLLLLKSRVSAPFIAVIDHHLNKYSEEILANVCNPLSVGHSELEYPSTTWVIKELVAPEVLNDSADIVALGVIGDLGKSILNRDDLVNWVSRVCKPLGLSVSDIFKACEYVDSCYKALDRDCIKRARESLMWGGVREVILNDYLRKVRDCVSKELEEVIASTKPEEVIDVGSGVKVAMFRVSTKYYITSSIGRELARRFREGIALLLNRVERMGMSYIYVRSYRYSLRAALDRLKAEGLTVGGKDSVFVITCSTEDCLDELGKALNALHNLQK